jgi:pentatricopeptide repeat protein
MGWMRAALNLLEKLQSEDVCADIITYNILISWHCKARFFDDANMLLNRAVADGITPNERTWGIMVPNFARKPLSFLSDEVEGH